MAFVRPLLPAPNGLATGSALARNVLWCPVRRVSCRATTRATLADEPRDTEQEPRSFLDAIRELEAQQRRPLTDSFADSFLSGEWTIVYSSSPVLRDVRSSGREEHPLLADLRFGRVSQFVDVVQQQVTTCVPFAGDMAGLTGTLKITSQKQWTGESGRFRICVKDRAITLSKAAKECGEETDAVLAGLGDALRDRLPVDIFEPDGGDRTGAIVDLTHFEVDVIVSRWMGPLAGARNLLVRAGSETEARMLSLNP